jgi:peptidyl-tRNA hydrolase, PTH1 family
MEQYLVVGLGNPGAAYEGTRHNIGFRVVRALAEKLGATFRPSLAQAKGNLAQAKIEDKMLFLLLPLTYMNESGLAVRKCLDYYKIPQSHCLIVVDDVEIPFETMRLREKGSSGGHNGLNSIAEHLGSEEYARLRIGVSKEQPLADYVLNCFSAEEEKELPKITERAVEKIEEWLRKKLTNGEENAKS